MHLNRLSVVFYAGAALCATGLAIALGGMFIIPLTLGIALLIRAFVLLVDKVISTDYE